MSYINNKLVSIIIPTFNSSTTLRECLRSIKNQTYKNIEIIIVDKNSNDDTVQIAKEFGCRCFVLNFNERCDQVNYGLSNAVGSYLYRVDSDFILDNNIVKECVSIIDDGFDAVCIHNTSDPSISIWSSIRKIERDCYYHDSVNVAARFFSSDVYGSVGGFDAKLIACEDYDFHEKIINHGYKIGYSTFQEIHIGEPRTLKEIAIKHYYYGKNIKNYIQKSPNSIKKLSPIRISLFKQYKKLIWPPRIFFGFVAYQTIRYSFAIIGLIVSMVKK